MEKPLSDQEIHVIRGMIDEYLYAERRRKAWRGRWSSGQRVIVVLAALVAFVLPLLNLLLNLTHH